MIEDFLASWPLFSTTYLAGWSIALVLSLVGVWVVARDQIFLGVAVSQASTLGIATALWLGGAGHLAWLEGDLAPGLLAVGASVTTALLTTRARESGRESAEAITGWVFLLAASLPVLMVAHNPHGLEEVHRLMFSTLLGVSAVDLWIFAVLAAITVLLAARFHAPLLLLAMDPQMAAAGGMRRRAWTAAVAVWLGLAVGLSIRASGLIYTFGCLFLPALAAKNLCREVRAMLVLAPALAVGTAAAGFVLAHRFDVPPAHASVGLLCGIVLGAWALAWSRRGA